MVRWEGVHWACIYRCWLTAIRVRLPRDALGFERAMVASSMFSHHLRSDMGAYMIESNTSQISSSSESQLLKYRSFPDIQLLKVIQPFSISDPTQAPSFSHYNVAMATPSRILLKRLPSPARQWPFPPQLPSQRLLQKRVPAAPPKLRIMPLRKYPNMSGTSKAIKANKQAVLLGFSLTLNEYNARKRGKQDAFITESLKKF